MKPFAHGTRVLEHQVQFGTNLLSGLSVMNEVRPLIDTQPGDEEVGDILHSLIPSPQYQQKSLN